MSNRQDVQRLKLPALRNFVAQRRWINGLGLRFVKPLAKGVREVGSRGINCRCAHVHTVVGFDSKAVQVSINVAGQQDKYVSIVFDVEVLVFVGKELLVFARGITGRPPFRLAKFFPCSSAK